MDACLFMATVFEAMKEFTPKHRKAILIKICTNCEDSVLLGIREPLAECCDSVARLSGKRIAAATKNKVTKTEVIDSPPRTGAAVCYYRVKVKK